MLFDCGDIFNEYNLVLHLENELERSKKCYYYLFSSLSHFIYCITFGLIFLLEISTEFSELSGFSVRKTIQLENFWFFSFRPNIDIPKIVKDSNNIDKKIDKFDDRYK